MEAPRINPENGVMCAPWAIVGGVTRRKRKKEEETNGRPDITWGGGTVSKTQKERTT